MVECTGNVEGLALARRAVRPLGTIVLETTYHGEVALDLSAVVVDEVTLVGSRCGPFAPALEALRAGRLDPRGLVEATAAGRGPGSLRARRPARRPQGAAPPLKAPRASSSAAARPAALRRRGPYAGGGSQARRRTVRGSPAQARSTRAASVARPSDSSTRPSKKPRACMAAASSAAGDMP